METPTPSPGVVAQATGSQPAASVPKMIEFERLPYSVRGLLSWLPEADWHLVNALVCHGLFIRELADVARLLDAVWTHSKKAEDWVTNRLTGNERDAYRVRVDAAIREIVTVAVELARRSRLTEILQRNRPLIVRYVPEVKERSGARSAEKKGSAENEPRRAAPPPPKAQTPPGTGPDLLGRWLAGIRRIREHDPSLARAAEVIAMYEKALDCAGPRRAEVEHQLAQYKEAALHAEKGAEGNAGSPPAIEAA